MKLLSKAAQHLLYWLTAAGRAERAAAHRGREFVHGVRFATDYIKEHGEVQGCEDLTNLVDCADSFGSRTSFDDGILSVLRLRNDTGAKNEHGHDSGQLREAEPTALVADQAAAHSAPVGRC